MLKNIQNSMGWQILANGLSHGVIIVDSKYQILFWNQWMEKNTGILEKDITGMNIFKTYPEISVRKKERYLINCIEKRIPVFLSPYLHKYFIPVEIINEGGSTYMIQNVKIYPAIDNGESMGAVIIIEDVTEQICHENELQKYRENLEKLVEEQTAELRLFKTIIESSHEAVAVCDAEGKLVYINPAHEKLFGRTLEEANRMNYRDYYPQESIEILNNEVAPAIAEGKSWEGELDVYDTKGRLFPLWERAGRILDDNGKMLYRFGFMHDITDRRQMEIMLRENERKYRELIQNARSIILKISWDDKILFFNEYAQEFFGYSESEVINKNVVGTIFLKRDINASEPPRIVFHKTEKYVHIENENICKNGKQVWVSWIHKPVFDEQGNIVEFLSVGTDITARKKAEDSLRKSEESLRESQDRIKLALEGTDMGIWDWYLDSSDIYLDDNWIRILGYEPGERSFDFDWLTASIHPDSLPVFKNAMSDYLNGKKKYYELEYQLKSKSEGWKWIWARGICVKYDEQGKPLRIIGTLRDITEQRKLEESLQKNRKLLQEIIDNSGAMIFVKDSDGLYILANKVCEQIIGLPKEEILGKNDYQIHITEVADKITANYMQVLETGESMLLEETFMIRGKEYNFLTSKIPLYDNDNKPYAVCGVAADITQLKHIEKELAKAKEAAERANRVKSEFLANMSHEIRTPMNAILGYSNLLSKLVSEEKEKKYLEIIQTSGKNLLSLINDVLDLSKIEAGKLDIIRKPVSLNTLFKEIRNIFEIKTKEKGVSFILETDPEIPGSLMLDEIRLRQILFNVVGNAVKFTEQGYVKLSAILNVGATPCGCPAPVGSSLSPVGSSLRLEPTNGKINLILKIEDTGIGISEDHKESIFNPFEQQKGQGSKYGGTGLGLTISKRLIEMMNGNISFISEVGRGTVFILELRDVEISPEVPEKPDTGIQIHKFSDFKGANILLAEDNHYNIALIKAILEPENIRVTEALNGEQAIEKLKNFKPDLILMDMKMPVMDGYRATEIIKADPDTMNIPVIALTADVIKANQERIQEIGCGGFVAKPVDENLLFAELMKFLPYHSDDRNHQNCALKTSDVVGSSLGLDVGSSLGLEPSLELQYKNITLVINMLSNELMNEWEQMKDTLILDKWIDFGKKIKELGIQNNISLLSDYGEKIIDNADDFNIIELKKRIVEYPEIVEIIKKAGGKYE